MLSFLLLLLLLLCRGAQCKPFHPNLDYTFVSSVSSLHFLASNHFDFNKLIYHGIPWLRRSPSTPPPTPATDCSVCVSCGMLTRRTRDQRRRGADKKFPTRRGRGWRTKG